MKIVKILKSYFEAQNQILLYSYSVRRLGKSLTCQETVLTALLALVQDTQIFRDVNVQSLRQLDVIKNLAYILKSSGSPGEEGCHMQALIIEIFSALVGSPPDLGVINELVQVALFLHDSTHTYVHHAKNSFYFAILPMLAKTANSSMTWPRNASRSAQDRSLLVKSASFNAQCKISYIFFLSEKKLYK